MFDWQYLISQEKPHARIRKLVGRDPIVVIPSESEVKIKLVEAICASRIDFNLFQRKKFCMCVAEKLDVSQSIFGSLHGPIIHEHHSSTLMKEIPVTAISKRVSRFPQKKGSGTSHSYTLKGYRLCNRG